MALLFTIYLFKQVLPPQSSSEWQMGITKIFLKEKLVGTLEEMRYNIEKKRLEKERLRLEEERKRREAVSFFFLFIFFFLFFIF